MASYLTFVLCLRQSVSFIFTFNFSAVTETVPELETAVFRQNRGEPKPRFFGAKWIQFRLPTFVFIYGTKPMSWFRRGDWRCL